MSKKIIIAVVTIFLCFFLLSNLIAKGDSLNNMPGVQIFEIHCAGCHLNGGNIIRRGKNLKMKALHKYGYDSVEAIASIVTNGKNNMSAFSDRLNETEIKNVAQYVFHQAENNWKS
jgi:cytochrome c6